MARSPLQYSSSNEQCLKIKKLGAPSLLKHIGFGKFCSVYQDTFS